MGGVVEVKELLEAGVRIKLAEDRLPVELATDGTQEIAEANCSCWEGSK